MIKIVFGAIPCILSGILWRMGGSSSYPSWVRQIGVATVFTIVTLVSALTQSFPFIVWWKVLLFAGITWGATYGLLTISYGITSPLGQLFSFIQNTVIRDIVIRGVCAIFWSLTYLIPVVYLWQWWRIVFCLIPIVAIPIIRISGVDQINPWIEEFLIGAIFTAGYCLAWMV